MAMLIWDEMVYKTMNKTMDKVECFIKIKGTVCQDIRTLKCI